MLIMRRRAGECILIGPDIEVQIVATGRTRVKVGIRAPKDVPVIAKEVSLVREENRAAASPELSAALRHLLEKNPAKQRTASGDMNQ